MQQATKANGPPVPTVGLKGREVNGVSPFKIHTPSPSFESPPQISLQA
jgi:hypothetical protein